MTFLYITFHFRMYGTATAIVLKHIMTPKRHFLPPLPINQTLLIHFNRGHPVVFELKSKTKCFKVTVKTQ